MTPDDAPFAVGQKVVCVKPINKRGDAINAPEVGGVYTVRDVVFDGEDGWGLLLAEITNPPAAYEEPDRTEIVCECGFTVGRFELVQ